jgi:hypothetical protein
LLPTPSPSEGLHRYLFAVRAIDNAGAEERILEPGSNTRVFSVSDQSGWTEDHTHLEHRRSLSLALVRR